MATTKVKFKSPFGTARYPHISKPDTQGKFADNKFKTKLVLPLGDPAAQSFIKVIRDAAVELHGQKGLKLYMPYVEDEEANEVVFTFKTNYAPGVFDGRGQPIGKDAIVGGGSVLRVAGAIVPYEKGISAQMNQCQIKELNGFGQSVFDVIEDGYEYEPSDESDETSESSPEMTNSALDI